MIFPIYSLTEEPFRVRFSRPFSSFHIAGKPLFGDPPLKCFTRRGRSKKFQHFRSQRYKSSLTSRCNAKGKIIGGIKGFLASKASILSTNFLLFTLLSLFLKKLFISFGILIRWIYQSRAQFEEPRSRRTLGSRLRIYKISLEQGDMLLDKLNKSPLSLLSLAYGFPLFKYFPLTKLS